MAFQPDSSLLNLPLARPWRRGFAMLADLTVIAFLTENLGQYIIPFLLLLWIYKSGWFQHQIARLGRNKNTHLRVISLLIIGLAIASNTQQVLNNDPDQQDSETTQSISTAFIVANAALQSAACPDAACWEPYIDDLIESISLTKTRQLTDTEINSLFEELIADSKLPADEIDNLKVMLKNRIKLATIENDMKAGLNNLEFTISDNEQKTDNSIMSWITNSIKEMGLGLGLAALYFSFFTAWGHGQTLGKILLNIQVIQLNNKPITLWDAFGRYGGYGAGLATGLLGFLQIYWDYNRQAIQDKISSTVVIDLGSKLNDTSQGLEIAS